MRTGDSKARALQRGVEFVMGSQGLGVETAEELLVALAGKLDRPVHELATDVADGTDFQGRPAWL